MLLDECEELFSTRNLYAALQIDNRTASYAELKKAYYRQSMIWHPDKETDEALKDIATRRFQMISRCYEVLSDKDKRAFYDRTGSVDEENTLSKEDAYNLLRSVLINVSPEDFKTFCEEYREKHIDEDGRLFEDRQTSRDDEMSLASADDKPTNDKPEPLCQTIVNEEGRFIVTVDVKVEERGDAPLMAPTVAEGFNTDDMSIMQIYVETIEAIPVRSNAEEAAGDADDAQSDYENNLEETMDSGHESEDAMEFSDSDNSSESDRPIVQNWCYAIFAKNGCWTCGHCQRFVAKESGRECKCKWVVLEPKEESDTLMNSCYAMFTKRGRWICGHCRSFVAKETGRECKCKWVVLEPELSSCHAILTKDGHWSCGHCRVFVTKQAGRQCRCRWVVLEPKEESDALVHCSKKYPRV